MHGQAIARDLLWKAQSKGDVKSIEVEVGDLSAVTVKELKDAVRLLAPQVSVKAKAIKAIVKCPKRKCGYSGKPKVIEKMHGLVLFECPKCRAIPKIVQGGEVVLKKIVLKGGNTLERKTAKKAKPAKKTRAAKKSKKSAKKKK